ncbi:putative type III restriction protein Res [Candidatus Nitrososphaera gargensis Ga9.2]|uniref:DNA 3'-5' helicase n=1 Tax=Nitrososphaera gargensis (strain Ga9.2) TaxID=1237085 RepID=K0IN76_NITGG|nr:DEAD/DEAH box helicase family protein [Candidatus Nitrososphaera gargensis]AFU58889.1 putative type III restriction protein Res [Candidatus Nitrososphaera gargensis Ga9.2]
MTNAQEEKAGTTAPPSGATNAAEDAVASSSTIIRHEGQTVVKQRNVAEVKARADRPHFVYNRVYVGLAKGPCEEYSIDRDTSVLTRDSTVADFMKKPYALIPQAEGNTYLLVVPKWIDYKAGWLETQTETYNIYKVDHYATWAGLVPEELREELDLKPRFLTLKIQGDYLVGSEDELDDAWIRYRDSLLRREEGIGIRIKPSRASRFNLASRLVEDGVIPWTSKPVEQRWKWQTDIQLRPYQQEAFDFFLKNGAMTLVYPFGGGKSFFGVYVAACISGRTLVVVPSLSLISVWQKYIMEHFPDSGSRPSVGLFYGAKKEKHKDITIATYDSALAHLTKEKYELLIFDESHHFPAETYSRLAFLDARYRLSLSGSPHREDGRSELIYVLGGAPYGSDWERLFKEGWVKRPEVYLHVTSTKLMLLKSLLEEKLKGPTMVFCDTIAIGEDTSRITGLPYIHGRHSLKERSELVRKHPRFIASRIFDEGIDLPDIKNIIEIDFLGGSRRQQLQRVGRLMHSVLEGAEYHLLMSPEELAKYGKRLYGLYSRNFRVSVVTEQQG